MQYIDLQWFISVAAPLLIVTVLVVLSILLASKKFTEIKDEIRTSVQSKFIQFSPEVKNLVELAKEIWRLEQRLLKHCNTEMADNQVKSIESSLRKLRRYLDTNDIEIRDYTNQSFNDGLNVEVLSIEDGASGKLWIKETVEPTIFFKGSLANKSKVILATK